MSDPKIHKQENDNEIDQINQGLLNIINYQMQRSNKNGTTKNVIEQIITPTTNSQSLTTTNYYTIQLQNYEEDKLQRFNVDSYRILRIYICTAAQQLARFVDSAISAGSDKSLLTK